MYTGEHNTCDVAAMLMKYQHLSLLLWQSLVAVKLRWASLGSRTQDQSITMARGVYGPATMQKVQSVCVGCQHLCGPEGSTSRLACTESFKDKMVGNLRTLE